MDGDDQIKLRIRRGKKPTLDLLEKRLTPMSVVSVVILNMIKGNSMQFYGGKVGKRSI